MHTVYYHQVQTGGLSPRYYYKNYAALISSSFTKTRGSAKGVFFLTYSTLLPLATNQRKKKDQKYSRTEISIKIPDANK